MKVYTAKEHSDLVERVYLWGLDMSWRATEVGIWLGTAKCGLGYVDLVRAEGDRIISNKTRRCYGPILIKFKEARQ